MSSKRSAARQTDLIDLKCGTEGCKCDNSAIWIKCPEHGKNGQLQALYDKTNGVLSVFCYECGFSLLDVQVEP